jgi:hypothetical protein
MQRSRAVFITGIVYALIGLVLAGGGIWLAALGGSIFYIILGVGILARCTSGDLPRAPCNISSPSPSDQSRRILLRRVNS